MTIPSGYVAFEPPRELGAAAAGGDDASRRRDGPGPWFRCQVCGTVFGQPRFTRLVVTTGEHEAASRHRRHATLNARARAGWVPVAEGLLFAVRARGHAVETDGDHAHGSAAHPNHFARLEAARDLALALAPARVTQRWAVVLVVAGERVAALGEPWHLAWPAARAAVAAATAARGDAAGALLLGRVPDRAWWT